MPWWAHPQNIKDLQIKIVSPFFVRFKFSLNFDVKLRLFDLILKPILYVSSLLNPPYLGLFRLDNILV